MDDDSAIIITPAQLAAINNLLSAARAALAELDSRDGPIYTPGDFRIELRSAINAIYTAPGPGTWQEPAGPQEA